MNKLKQIKIPTVRSRTEKDLEKVANYLLENSEYYSNKAEEYNMDVYDLYDEALEEAENMDNKSFNKTLKEIINE